MHVSVMGVKKEVFEAIQKAVNPELSLIDEGISQNDSETVVIIRTGNDEVNFFVED